MFKPQENSITVSETRRLTRASVCVHWPLTGSGATILDNAVLIRVPYINDAAFHHWKEITVVYV